MATHASHARAPLIWILPVSNTAKPFPTTAMLACDHHAGEPHYERSGAYRAKPVSGSPEMTKYPIDERGHPGALNGECERYENECGAGLIEYAHERILC